MNTRFHEKFCHLRELSHACLHPRSVVARSGRRANQNICMTFRLAPGKPMAPTPHMPVTADGRQRQATDHERRPLQRMQTVTCSSSSTSSNNSVTATVASTSITDYEPSSKQVQRKRRLMTLLELRRVYRNILHASSCLEVPSPVYRPPSQKAKEVGVSNGTAAAAAAGVAAAAAVGTPPAAALPAAAAAAAAESAAASAAEDEKEREMVEQEAQNEALAIVAEMQLTSDQLKASLRALPRGFGWVFGAGQEEEGERMVRQVAHTYASQLRERVSQELPLLPFGGAQQAQALVDARNARYTRRRQTQAQGLLMPSFSAASMDQEPGSSTIERLEAAEKVAEQFVQRRIKPALRRAREAELGDLLRGAGSYLKGLWLRLNGGGRGGRQSALEAMRLPLPVSARKESELATTQLSLELDLLEKKLQEASKAREKKLRKAGLPGRVQMAVQLKGLDADVLELSQLLAVRTLELEMEFIYRSLEDEALDVAGYDSIDVLSEREGSSTELALLVADFVLLDEQLMALSQALATTSSSSGSDRSAASATSGRSTPLGILGESVLAKLAIEIPDMCVRVGVLDQTVFGGQGFSVTRIQLQGQEALAKVREAIDFMVRGVRLLGSDVTNSGRLFMRAALGGTLKPREVSALRRTARDVLTFIPFTIILIVPISPLGHVLVFSLIQTYFPSFFPSCFTKKRQEIMLKYDELPAAAADAQDRAELAEEEAELARAAAAVARLTAPDDSPSSSDEALDTQTGQRAAAAAAVAALSSRASGKPLVARLDEKLRGAVLEGDTGTAAGSSVTPSSAAVAAAGGAAAAPPAGDSVDVHTETVRQLEERLSKVLQNVNLGDTSEDEEEAESRRVGREGGAANGHVGGVGLAGGDGEAEGKGATGAV